MIFIDFLPRVLCMQPCRAKVEPVKASENDVAVLEEMVVKLAPNSELGKIHAELKFISDRMREEDYGALCEDNWKYVATVFDR